MDKIKNTTADQKAKYEERKEQERKRRFAILAGNIKPISTSFRLKSGEHAYFQFDTTRMADNEYVKSYTQGQARSPFLKGGILRGNTTIDTTTSQSRITRNETIDSGKMLFTNKRILFIGKEVISIFYEDILAVEFNTSTMTIKYPQMLKAECYSIANTEPAMYYKGIQRLIGNDKSVAKLEDVQIDWPDFVVPKEKSSGNRWYKSNAVTILLLIVFFPLGLFWLWKFARWNKKTKWVITGIGAVLYLIFVIGANSTPTQQAQKKPIVPMKTQKVVKTTTPVSTLTPIQAYLSQIMNIQFDQMDVDKSDIDQITTLGVSQVKSDIQNSLNTSQGILSTLQTMHVTQEMEEAHSSFLAGVNESIKASTLFLSGLTDNSTSDIASAKNMFTQADADIAQGQNSLFTYEQQRYGSFATMSFNFNGMTIKNNFDVPIDCQIYMEASAKNWSIAWDYHEDVVSDDNGSLTIDPLKSKTLTWSHITDGNDQPTFNYPPSEPYDVHLDCQVVGTSQEIAQKMENQ